jgi:tripartite-type tricarboxylate transporter receptor subunit TctC
MPASPPVERRRLLAAGTALSLLASPTVHAQGEAAWPVRQVRFLIPFAAGGGQDVFWRILADRLSRTLRATFIVENKAGAGGGIGALDIVRAAPDGGAFLTTTNSLSILPALYPALGFDPERDLAPVSLLCDVPVGILVRADSPYRDLLGLIAAARAAPARLTYGSGGVGTSNHLAAALLAVRAGIEVTHVPYRGVSQAVTAVYAGDIDYTFGSMLELGTHARQGRARLLGVTSTTRMAQFPDVPSVAEILPGYAALTWFGMFAPRGLPAALLRQMADELAALREDAELAARIAAAGAVIRLDGPRALATRMAEDVATWKDVVARLGIRAD